MDPLTICMLQINFCIHGGFLWTVKEVGDAWEWILVLLGDFVEALEVGTKLERAIFLLGKEDWSTMRREQGLDESHG